MFLFRRRVAAAPAVAPLAPPNFNDDEFEEHVKYCIKWSIINYAGVLVCHLFLLVLFKFLVPAVIENFKLQPMDQYHRFMAAILLLFLVVVLYHIVFIKYERAQTIIIMATPFFVSPFFDKEIYKLSSKIFVHF